MRQNRTVRASSVWASRWVWLGWAICCSFARGDYDGPLSTLNPRNTHLAGWGYGGCLGGCFQGYRGGAMQHLGYELPRISIPRTPMNRGARGPSIRPTGF